MSLVNYIEQHTFLGSALTVGHVVIGNNLPAIATSVESYSMPPIFIQTAQLLAYLASFTVGCITVYGFYKKQKKNEQK